MKRNIHLLFCAILLWMGQVYALSTKGIHSKFNRTVEYAGSIEEVVGEIYILFPSRIYMHISFPVNQIIYLKNDEMLIYYPESNEGFHYASTSPLDFGWLTAIAGNGIESALENMKLEKKSEEIPADTVITEWIRTKAAKPKNDEFSIITRVIEGKLRKMELMNGGVLLSAIEYDKYIEFGDGFLFPKKILNTTFAESGRTKETIIFSDVESMERIPLEIIDFSFPPDADVRYTE